MVRRGVSSWCRSMPIAVPCKRFNPFAVQVDRRAVEPGELQRARRRTSQLGAEVLKHPPPGERVAGRGEQQAGSDALGVALIQRASATTKGVVPVFSYPCYARC